MHEKRYQMLLKALSGMVEDKVESSNCSSEDQEFDIAIKGIACTLAVSIASKAGVKLSADSINLIANEMVRLAASEIERRGDALDVLRN